MKTCSSRSHSSTRTWATSGVRRVSKGTVGNIRLAYESMGKLLEDLEQYGPEGKEWKLINGLIMVLDHVDERRKKESWW